MRKIIMLSVVFFTYISSTFSNSTPEINCTGLPGCTKGGSSGGNIGLNFIVNVTSEFIKFIAVVAVFALIFSGIMYLISMGEEEKVNKAKNWIIYSLVGVLLSASAWGIINLINNFRIG